MCAVEPAPRHERNPPEMVQGRVVLAPMPEDYADVYEAARAGRLPSAPLMVCVADAQRRLSLTLPLVAVSPAGGWRDFQAPMAALAAKALARHIPGFAGALTSVTVMAPPLLPRPTLAHILAPAGARAHTRVSGLYLCGADAEPLPCVSGRAGRFAAHFVRKGSLASI
jgi:phytoene dehydrogenase-like protein